MVAALLAHTQRRVLGPDLEQARKLGKEVLAQEARRVDLDRLALMRVRVGAEPVQFIWCESSAVPGSSRVRSSTTPTVSAMRLGEWSVLAGRRNISPSLISISLN